MPRYEYSVELGNGTPILDVQNIVIQTGRVQITDTFRGSTATITGRNPSALPTLDIGDIVQINADQGVNFLPLYAGVIADVKVVFGNLPSMDTYEISLEDSLAKAGRSFTTDTASFAAGITPAAAASAVVTNALTGSALLQFNTNSTSKVSAQSVPNTNVLDLLNQLMATEQGFLTSGGPINIDFNNRSKGIFLSMDFTDDSLITINPQALYTDVTFRSQADSFFTKVVVEPQGLAPQSSGTGTRVFTIKTFDETTGQAQNLADYLLSTLQVQQSVPSTISCFLDNQFNNAAIDAFRFLNGFEQIGLILRGTQYVLTPQGATLTATPEQSRITFNVASAAALTFFILDNSAFGRLDADKLGF